MVPKPPLDPGIVPAEVFQPRNPGRHPTPASSYGTPAVGGEIVGALREYLGVTPYRIGILVDAPSHSYVYHWISGAKTPSSLYLSRLCWLMVMKAHKGMDVARIEAIDWKSGAILWHEFTRRDAIDSIPVASGHVSDQ